MALAIRGDGKLALQATGAAELNLGEGFASASVESIGIAFNNTGADVNRMVSVIVGDTSVTAPLKVTQGQAALVLNGLQATVGGFVTVAGNFGVQKTTGATAAARSRHIVRIERDAGGTTRGHRPRQRAQGRAVGGDAARIETTRVA